MLLVLFRTSLWIKFQASQLLQIENELGQEQVIVLLFDQMIMRQINFLYFGTPKKKKQWQLVETVVSCAQGSEIHTRN